MLIFLTAVTLFSCIVLFIYCNITRSKRLKDIKEYLKEHNPPEFSCIDCSHSRGSFFDITGLWCPCAEKHVDRHTTCNLNTMTPELWAEDKLNEKQKHAEQMIREKQINFRHI